MNGSNPSLSPSEFFNAMQEIVLRCGADSEAAHLSADQLLCDQMDCLGYGEGIEIFKAMVKYYA